MTEPSSIFWFFCFNVFFKDTNLKSKSLIITGISINNFIIEHLDRDKRNREDNE